MKLYYFPLSPNSRKVLATTRLLALTPELITIDLQKGAQKSDEYLLVNPNGKVPALVDGDLVLWESNAICQYLATMRDTTLYPNDARARAEITRWFCWQLSTWAAPCSTITNERFYKRLASKSPDEVRLAEGLQQFREASRILDKALADRAFLVGSQLTLADLAIAGSLTYAKQAELPLTEHQNLNRWFERVEHIDAWRSTTPLIG